MLQMILAVPLLCVACAVDCLVTGLAYGTDKIKIPLVSGLIVNIISTAMLVLSLALGSYIGRYIPSPWTLIFACSVLCAIGLYKIAKSILKTVFKNAEEPGKELKISLFSLTFFIRVCKSPTESDIDKNKILSAKEAAVLALALSLDGMAAGLSTGFVYFGAVFFLTVAAFSFALGILFLYAGRFLGGKIAQKASVNLSWLSGVLLIGLAATKLFL